MKKIIFLLLISANCYGQNFYIDSILRKVVCNVQLTDSASHFYNQDLKMHVDISDRGDTINGATFTFTLYTVNPKNTIIVFSNSLGISDGYYMAWDANDDKKTYQIVQSGLSGQNIFITFK